MYCEKQVLNWFESLHHNQKKQVLEKLCTKMEFSEENLNELIVDIQERSISPPQCKYCKSSHTLRRGKIKGIQRYSCKSCKKYWMATDGTGLFGIRKRELWYQYLRSFYNHRSLRAAALDVGISLQTSFRWRHRIIASMSELMSNHISGTIEIAGFQIPKCMKGLRRTIKKNRSDCQSFMNRLPEKINILIAVSRGKKDLFSIVLASERINPNLIKKALVGKVNNGSAVITEHEECFKEIEKNIDASHYPVKSEFTGRQKDPIHLKNIRKAYFGIKEFLMPFRGVSTKYLQNYLTWYHFERISSMRLDRRFILYTLCLTNKYATQWMNRISNYDTFIIT